jgi:hypothetical protein
MFHVTTLESMNKEAKTAGYVRRTREVLFLSSLYQEEVNDWLLASAIDSRRNMAPVLTK